MPFVPSIYEKRHEFYLNFANEFFTKVHKNHWLKNAKGHDP